MKSIVIIFLGSVLLLFANTTYGQDEPQMLRFGIKMGMTSSTFARDFQPNTDPRIAFGGGVALEIQPADFLSVSFDALYIERGFSNKVLSTSPYKEENVAIYGVDAPLSVNIYPLGIRGRAIPRVTLGHSFGFNIFARSNQYTQIGEIAGTPYFAESWQNVTSRYRLLDFGAVAGAGLLLPSDMGLFSIDFTYRIGYLDISPRIGKTTTNTGAVSVAFWF